MWNPRPAAKRWIGIMAWQALAAFAWVPPSCAAAETVGPEGEMAKPIVTRFDRPRSVALERASLSAASAKAAPSSSVTFLSLEHPPEGDMPLDLAFTSSSEVAILNRDTSNVTFLDTALDTITRSVAVGQLPVDLAVTPDGRYALTADLGSNTVSVIDLATHTVTATIPVGGREPFQIEVSADSRFAVVALINDAIASAFSVIDLGTLREVRTIPSAPQGAIGAWFTPAFGFSADVFTRFALTPDGRKIVLPVLAESRVAVYDRETGAQLASIPTATGPLDVDVSSDGAFAVIGHETSPISGRITRIDLQALHATGEFPVPFQPSFQRVRITPDRGFALATGFTEAGEGVTAFVSLQTGAVTAVLSSGAVEDIVFTADGRYAFLASTIPGYVLDIAGQRLATNLPPPGAALYRAAASPTGRRAAAIDTKFGASVYLYDLSGPTATLSAMALTGEIPESDVPASIALTPDGALAVAGHRISGNVAVVDVVANTVRGWVDTGRDVRDVATAVTPNGAWGLAANSESNTFSVIDLTAMREVASLLVPDGPERILVAPDGRTAYVFTIRGQDQVHVVALDGAASRVLATLPTVNRFGLGGGLETTDVALSGDGAVLAVCGGAPNTLQLIDTASRREIARVPLGGLPIRVALSRDHTKAWVSDLSHEVTVVQIGSSTAAVQAVIPIDSPFDLHLDAAGAFVYVVSTSIQHPAVYVLDAVSNFLVKTVDVPSAPNTSLGASGFAAGPSLLYVAGVDAQNPSRAIVTRLVAAGANTRVQDVTTVSGYPSDLALTDDGQLAVLAHPYLGGVDLARFDAAAQTCVPSPTRLCLNQGRFQVEADWRTPQRLTGDGQRLPLTDDSGAFWFFSPANLEMIVKVLDGCGVNNRYWIFAAGLTDVEVHLRVTDTRTGMVRTYTNPLRTAFQPIQDTSAFATCP